MSDAWQAAKLAIAERDGPWIAATLEAVAREVWGGDVELGWDPDVPLWRAYQYLGSAGRADHRYRELGVAATIAPSGALMGLQLDDGRDFLALADVSEDALRQGLAELASHGQPQVSRSEPAYPHRIHPYGAPARGGPAGWLWRLLGR